MCWWGCLALRDRLFPLLQDTPQRCPLYDYLQISGDPDSTRSCEVSMANIQSGGVADTTVVYIEELTAQTLTLTQPGKGYCSIPSELISQLANQITHRALSPTSQTTSYNLEDQDLIPHTLQPDCSLLSTIIAQAVPSDEVDVDKPCVSVPLSHGKFIRVVFRDHTQS